MNLKQKIILITVIIFSVIAIILINLWNNVKFESDSLRTYAQALELYKAEDYHKAYKEFGRISAKSNLKPAAIYRQARCGEYMQSNKLMIRNYKKLIRNYPNFGLNARVEYLLAQNKYSKSPIKSKKSFQKILKKYPNSEYAIAAKYYLGLIQILELEGIENKTKLTLYMQKAEDYFKEYLKDAPAGRFAVSSINKIKELNLNNLTNEENLIIGRSYYALGEFDLARKHFNLTDLNQSWCDIVKNYYELRNWTKIKETTEKGIKLSDSTINKKDLYRAIDLYLQANTGNKNEALSKLSDLSVNKPGEDYVKYLKCQNSPNEIKDYCYSELYYKFPEGQFAADALSNIFYSNIKSSKYKSAQKLGEIHLNTYANANSTAFVLFWMGKIEEHLKNYEESREYYKKVIEKYPDSYYAYRAYVDMYRLDNSLFATELVYKPVVFPYEKSKDGNLVIKLALLKDYGLVDELCKNDKFVQSWLAYEKGAYTTSVVLARDAMDEMQNKPPKTDFRWRLVYPMHYYNEAVEFSLNNNPILLLAIIKEESHFNPKATSFVGARGLMQLMPQTANEVKNGYRIKTNDPDYLYNPRLNIQLGSLYYSKLKRINNGDDVHAILSYNGGAGSVKSWINKLNYNDKDEFLEQIPYPETQNYLKKVLKAYWNYARIYDKD